MAPSFNSEVVPLSEVPHRECPETDSSRPRVLVVDDEPLVTDTLAMILSRAGFEAMTAYAAGAALEKARRKHPAFLLTDVHMPGMNGVELALAMVREFPSCKVLLFSGHATAHDLADSRAAGHEFPLLAKPIHPEEIVKHIRERLSYVEVPHRLRVDTLISMLAQSDS